MRHQKADPGDYLGLPLSVAFPHSLVLFTAGPIIAALILSFTSYDGLGVVEPRFIGIDNYERALSSTTVRAAFQNTAYYVLIYVPSTLSIALLAAIALNQKVRGVLWFRAAFFVPVVTSGVATAIMWLWVLNHNGLMNYVIGLIGIKPVSWFGFDMAFNSIIMIGVWGGLGVIMMFWLAALQACPSISMRPRKWTVQDGGPASGT